MRREAEEPPRRRSTASNPRNIYQVHPMGDDEKGGSVMAKLHARPSNQYRYEHYDPRVGGQGIEGPEGF
jgi:hypothetical protein